MAVDGFPDRLGAHRGQDGERSVAAPRPQVTAPRSARRVATLVAALAVASATLVSPPAFACGYHSAADMAAGMLNWMYPKALHVRTAVWQAENTGVLAPRSAAPAKDMFAFNRVIRNLGAFGARLKAGTQTDGSEDFSVVLLDSMMWTNFTAGDGGYRVLTHVQGPAGDDVVVVTHSKVLAAILAGQLDTASAESFGLVRLYGTAEQVEMVRGSLETSAASLDTEGTTTRLTGLQE